MKIVEIKDKKDKNGNDMKVLTMEDKTTVFVNSKYDKETFDAVSIDKEIEVVKEGEYFRIMPESLGITPKPKTDYKKTGMTEAVKIKAASIKEAQEIKGGSIKFASAARDASLMLSVLIPSLYKNCNEEELKAKWQEWRAWFMQRFEDKVQNIIEPF